MEELWRKTTVQLDEEVNIKTNRTPNHLEILEKHIHWACVSLNFGFQSNSFGIHVGFFFVLGHEFYAFFKWFHSTHSKNKQTHTHTDTQSKLTLWGKNSLSFALIWCDNKKVWIVSWKCWQKFNDNVMMKQHNELCGNKTVRSKMANLHTAFGCMHTQRDLQILPTKALTEFSRYYNQLPWPIVWIQTKIRSFFLIGWCTCFWFPFLRFETKCSVKLQSVLNASIRSHMNVYAHAINLEIMMKFL